MKKQIKFLFAALLVIPCIAVFAACDLFGNGNGGDNTKTPTKLVMTQPVYDDATKLVTWGEVANAQSYAVTLTGTGVNKSASVSKTDRQYEITETESGSYTIGVTAKGDGTNYSDSDAKTVTADYTRADGLIQLVITGLAYDDTTKTVSWDKLTGAAGYTLRVGADVKPSELITESGNKMQYVLDEEENGAYTVYVKAAGNGAEYADSAEKSVQCAYTTLTPSKRARMEAFAAWETAFKTAFVDSIHSAGAQEVAQSFNAVEITDSTTAGKSVVTVHATYSKGSGVNVGSLSYEINEVSGETYQDKLNDICGKITRDNIVDGSRHFEVANSMGVSINTLSKSVKLPTCELKTLVQTQDNEIHSITKLTTPIVLSTTRDYRVGGLVEIDGKYYDMNFQIVNPNDMRDASVIYGDLGNSTGGQILGITQIRWRELDASANLFIDLKAEYDEWLNPSAD